MPDLPTPEPDSGEHFRAHRDAMLDVWLALGGDVVAFERMMIEDRRTDADTWAQLMAMIRQDYASLMADTNPPCGPEFEALMLAAFTEEPRP